MIILVLIPNINVILKKKKKKKYTLSKTRIINNRNNPNNHHPITTPNTANTLYTSNSTSIEPNTTTAVPSTPAIIANLNPSNLNHQHEKF